ncbi:MAG: EAL domain-containing protein [Pseudomonadales bacterium]|nr:EAL domain-containing protein [Pseudomonadales bacterium]
MDLTDLELAQDRELERQRQEKRTAIVRIFNYYRTFLSFSLLLLFVQLPNQEFVGTSEPWLFQVTILAYIGFNILASLLSLIFRAERVAKTPVIFSLLGIDIIMLALLMFSSGGVSSGLGNFLVFPVAFAGVLIVGRLSLVVAAIAVILTIYCESTLMMRGGMVQYDLFFQAGLLGVVLFSVNLLFQYVSKQLRKKEDEVTTLEKLNEMRRIAEIARSELEDSNARFEILLNCAGDGVLGLDLNGDISFANPKACSLLELSRRELVAHNISEFAQLDARHGDTITEFQSYSLLHELQLKASSEGLSWIDANGNSFYVEYSCEPTLSPDGELTGAVVLFQDVTERKETEQKMHYLANYDALTDLVNRSYFQASLEKAIARARRGTSNVAVLLLDLDHFKYVNDHYGHDVGDALLSEASKRLMTCIRTGDTAARLGGDEFAVMLLDFTSTNNVAIVARSLVDEISRPYVINGIELNISTSIGVSVYEEHDQTADSMLKSADTAMYEAKKEGRGTYRFFHSRMQEEAEETQRIQVQLQKAIERNEFKIHYQPIVSLKDHSIHHCEALIRWKPHGEEEAVPPDVFIPIAEECGKINEIGDWILRSVIEQIQAWHEHLGIYPRIAVNVSTKQLRSCHFRDQLKRHLADHDVPVDAIEIELTETGVMDDPHTVMKELIELHELGVKISIDDFGTGYSSLDYLRRLPIDQVKIDKSFVRAIGEKNDKEIVKVIIAMAHTMGLHVVAEGIETDEQANILQSCGCDLGQGYLFSAPRDTLGITQFIKEQDQGFEIPNNPKPENVISLHGTPSH